MPGMSLASFGSDRSDLTVEKWVKRLCAALRKVGPGREWEFHVVQAKMWTYTVMQIRVYTWWSNGSPQI